ncbi:hypothetical protein ACFL59_10675 [Planctomycetota bacterium]
MPKSQTIGAQLRRLVTLPESDSPFLSVYLDTETHTRQAFEGLRIFLKNEARKAQALLDVQTDLVSFRHDLEHIQRYVEKEIHVDHTANGLAIFACARMDIFQAIHARRPFRNALLVANRPVVRQLAVLLEEHAPVLAALIDSRSARIFEITLGDEVHETDVESDIRGQHKTSSFHGFGDLKYQRDLRDRVADHHKEVAGHLHELMKRHGYSRIVVLGQERAVAAFKKLAPKKVREAIIATGPMDRRERVPAIVGRVMEAVEAEERRVGTRLVESIRNQALSGNLAVYGLRAVLDAVARGHVYKLAVAKGTSLRGWRCRGCGTLQDSREASGCTRCAGEVYEVGLFDEMVKDAIAQGSEVETVKGSEELERMGNVGALLRYRD